MPEYLSYVQARPNRWHAPEFVAKANRQVQSLIFRTGDDDSEGYWLGVMATGAQVYVAAPHSVAQYCLIACNDVQEEKPTLGRCKLHLRFPGHGP